MSIGRAKKVLLLASALMAIIGLQEIQWVVTKKSVSSNAEENKTNINNFSFNIRTILKKNSDSSVAEEDALKIANSIQGTTFSQLEGPSWIKNVSIIFSFKCILKRKAGYDIVII